jgi:prepilin-type N-terminal cleavage/methylation domain-containing protein
MKKNFKGGFTLIELLVVIAIIGILASVVLASLNIARAKGADANIKANLANARAQAELFYDNNTSTYNNVCLSTSTGGIYPLISAAASTAGVASGTVTRNNSSATTATTATCNDNGSTGWAAEVPLKQGGFYCVDSTGASKSGTSAMLTGSTDTTC